MPVATTSNPKYVGARNNLLTRNEGFSSTIYFDTNGIPTVGAGVALLQSNGRINTENMANIANVLGVNSPEYIAISSFVQTASDAVVGTPSMGVARTVSAFNATARGQALMAAFGGVGIHYVPGSSFVLNQGAVTVTAAQAIAITGEAANSREAELDSLIASVGGDPATLSIAERAVMMDVLYQYGARSSKTVTAVRDFFSDGGGDLRLLNDVASTAYPQRLRNDTLLINGQVLVGNASSVPTGTIVGPNQFYVDQIYNDLDSISSATGVSVAALLGLNAGLGITSGSVPLSVGQLIKLPAPTNLINITVNPNPQPQTQIQNENQLSQNASNGYVSNSATSSVSFSGNTLDKTDFASTQMGALASGGVRPGEVQLDPNARPNTYLSQFYVDPGSTGGLAPNLLNAATLNGLAAMTTVNTYVDPILLDLTGNGVHMTSMSNGVLFDTDNSGTLKRTGWADTQSGMLVMDDGSGQIKSISQMFSEYFGGQAGTTGGPGQTPFKNGFAALASVDANHDGVIDRNDPIWSKLKVWVDTNHDGKSETGELKTLDELGITSINVNATTAPSGQTLDGNEVLATGSFVINGKTQQAMAVDFLGSPVSSTVVAQGNGTKVTSTANGTTTTAYTDTSTANETLDAGKLGVSNVYAGSGNDTLIAAQAGSWLVGGGGSNTYQGGAGNDVFVVSAKDNPANIHGNGGTDTAIIVGDQGVTLNMAQDGLTIAEGGRGDDVIESGGRQSVFIKGGQGNDTLVGGAGNDVIVGGSGRNLIIGGSGKAEIYAGPNGDTIYAAQGDSIINAGGGNDHIYGGAGNDVITVGRGNAVIDGGGGTNLVTFHGSYGDYRIVSGTHQGVSGYWVADKVANRDGTVFISNIQKLNFADISAVDITQANPMPVADSLTADNSGKVFDHTQPHLIAAAQLLANDQRLNSQGPLHIAAVGSAIGGTVALTSSGDVLFTPDASFTGIMSFKYSAADAAGHTAATVQNLNNGQTAGMQATATLLMPDLPTDPLLADEWYLNDTDVLPVWKDYTGKGVRIGQFEPGGQFATSPETFDFTHPDLAPNVDPAWLATQTTNGTLPTETSNHATMVAGVMVAAKNATGGVGVAYDATLAGYYLANNGSDLSGLGHMVSYDIANNSWDFQQEFALSNVTNGSINAASTLLSNAQYAADNGRGGLGTVIVEAGGNARAAGGNAEGSLTNNNRFSIEVGAINAQGDLSTLRIGSAPFSNPGASLLVSAPGSNIESTSQIVVTDQGSTFGSSYSDMQGTSFATPIVSGIVALMLQANPNLGYRDVQEILALSARTVNDPSTQWSTNGATDWNGGGMHVSNDYGFGEVDARAAVRLAETWMTQSSGANEMMYSASSGSVNKSTTAGGTITSTLAMNSGLNVEHVEIDLNANVGRLGDLIVTLVAPDGTKSILLSREGVTPSDVTSGSTSDVGSTQSGNFQYTFMSTHDWGEVSAGNWTLQVTDAATGLPVTLNNWSLRLYGSTTSADNTYYYTDEYKTAALSNANRAVLDDAVNGVAGGRNTINSAAVSGGTSINLLTGVASIGGTALSIHNPGTIQNIVTGDGNDTLTANNADALLDGGRGQNTLVGGTGKDLFVIHQRSGGTDTIVNFNAARGELIDLVGFKGMKFGDLVLTQQGANVKVDLGNGQSIILTNQTVSAISAAQFVFQDSFVAPAAYVTSGATTTTPPSGTDVLTLNGGWRGVSYTTTNGQLVGTLTGTVTSHDSATSDIFVVAKQIGVTSYQNAVRGFKHGVDKIDVSQLGITTFSDLAITLRTPAIINGVAQIHGAQVASTSLGSAASPMQLAYLDAIDPGQLTASDFIFASPIPGQAGVQTTPVTSANASSAPVVPAVSTQANAAALIGSNNGVTTSTDANGVVTVQSSVDYALSDSINRLTLTGTGDVIGTANNNGDVLTGNAGNDTLIGGDGNDTLVAGAGSDLLIGGGGTNTYIVNAGGGVDTIQAGAGQGDTLVLQGVTPGAVHFSMQGTDLVVSLNPGQATASEVVVTNQFSGQGVGAISLGGQTFSAATIAAIVQNGAVAATRAALAQTESSAASWSYALPANLFTAPVSGDLLTYSATLANGAPLPSGLTFDPVRQMLSGTAGINPGDLSIKVTATDLAGASASTTVALHVSAQAGKPIIGALPALQTVAAGSAWNWTLPAGLFSPGSAGDTLTYTAMQTDGTALPAWLKFDPVKQAFSGTPTDATTGTFAVKIVATETGGLTSSATLNVQVNPTYQAPTVGLALAVQTVAAGTAWSYALPVTLFGAAIAGDMLTYKATLANGDPLPSWLTFDPVKQTFSGTPTDQVTGAFALKVTATDMGGLASSTTLNLQVNPTYAAPTVATTLAMQTLAAGTVWNYTLPADLFNESIAGDTLTYKATLANGDPLPSWLTFDPVKQTFGGAPTDQTTGALALKLTAKDMGGLATSTTLSLQVNPAYQAPTATQTLSSQSVTTGTAWSYSLPATLFSEAVAGDTLKYSATLADGTPLPAWLSFDATKLVFSGTPPSGLSAAVALRVTATDMGGLSASAALNIVTAAPATSGGKTPVVTQTLSSPTIAAGTLWSYALPAALFSESAAGDTLTYKATLANGSPLPSWLTFDPVKLTFSGTPTDQTTGALQLKIIATEQGGLSASAPLNVTVNPAYAAPTASQPLFLMTALGQPLQYTLPPALFYEPIAGDTLTYSATMADGSALPSWLTFDPVKQSFSGMPPGQVSSALNLKITAKDLGGLASSTALTVQLQTNILNVNTFQTLAAPTGQIAILEANAFSTVTAGDENHVLLMAGSFDSAKLGNGANWVAVTGSQQSLTLGDGNNVVQASGAMDVLTLGKGNNVINASGTFDTVTVGAGSNRINATGSFATVKLGDGSDTVTLANTFATATVGHGTYNLEFGAGFGALKFGADTASDHLWFQHVGQDLQITAVGVGGTVTLKNWYASTPEQPGSIVAGDGRTLSSSGVNQLVQAMSAFAPPAAGSTSFTAAEQQALKPVLAANWH